MLDCAGKNVAIRRRCALLSLARSGVSQPPRPVSGTDLMLVARIDWRGSTNCSRPIPSMVRGG